MTVLEYFKLSSQTSILPQYVFVLHKQCIEDRKDVCEGLWLWKRRDSRLFLLRFPRLLRSSNPSCVNININIPPSLPPSLLPASTSSD